jgi:hypothetical protein
MGDRGDATRYWWGNLKEMGLVGKSRHRWAENEVDLEEMGWEHGLD